MTQELDALRTENARLRELADRDSLTGLLNRGATQARVDSLLRETGGGVLLALDVDEFKRVNDRFGHLLGDQALQEIGRVLRYYLFFKDDIAGRVGGDEFVLFLTGTHAPEFIESKAGQLRQRVMQIGRDLGVARRLGITVGVAYAREGDDYRSLFERADQALLAGKQAKNGTAVFYEEGMQVTERPATPGGAPVEAEGISADMVQIRRQLREQEVEPGAYCQDYATFQCIYRFVERGLLRSTNSVYLLLITLTDRAGGYLPPDLRETMVGLLKGTIQSSLRLGDVFTQYSSGQFLIMVVGASHENAEMISDRISLRYSEALPSGVDVCLQHDIYPLEAAAGK